MSSNHNTDTTHDAPEPEYLTIREAAALLRCHPDTVAAGIRRGELSAVRIGRTVRLPLACLAAGVAADVAPKPRTEN